MRANHTCIQQRPGRLRYGQVTLGLELKVWREDRLDLLKAGLVQLDRYLAGLGLETG